MSITIHSIPYDYSVTFPKESYVELFPDSLIATTMSLDPTAEVIDIPNRDVTPNILNIIQYMTLQRALPQIIPSENYIQASNYLLIDILAVFADLELPKFLQIYSDINLLYLSPDNSMQYESILNFGMRSKATYIIWYLFQRVPSNTYPKLDEKYFMGACYFGGIGVVQYSLTGGRVNPHTAWMSSADYDEFTARGDDFMYRQLLPITINQSLFIATYQGHLDVVNLLLQDRRITYESNTNTDIYHFAFLSGSIDVTYAIVTNPRADVNIGDHDLTLNAYHPEFLRVMLINPHTDPTLNDYSAVHEAFFGNHAESFNILLLDSRIDPMKAINDIVNNPHFLDEEHNSYLINSIYQNPRIDINQLPERYWEYVRKYMSTAPS